MKRLCGVLIEKVEIAHAFEFTAILEPVDSCERIAGEDEAALSIFNIDPVRGLLQQRFEQTLERATDQGRACVEIIWGWVYLHLCRVNQ